MRQGSGGVAWPTGREVAIGSDLGSMCVSSGLTDSSGQMVTTGGELRRVCRRLRSAGMFGFDTEFIRENSYLPQLCLIQAATRDFVVMIDPFEVDVDPFWRLVVDPGIEKVVHAGEQDLQICHIHTGRVPRAVFDIQVAAGLVGMDYPLSYGKLVLAAFGVETKQGKSFTDWARRPLTPGQLRYAVEDVQHLVALRDHLHGRLRELGRLDWMREEMAPAEDPQTYAYDSLRALQRLRGWRRMGRQRLAILRELTTWRDAAARKADLPPRTLLRDGAMKNVARHMPKTIAQLRQVKGFPRPLARQMGPEVLKTLEMAMCLDESDWPDAAARETDPDDKTLVSRTIEAVQAFCVANDLNPALVASRAGYVDLLHALRHERRPPKHLRLATGWRKRFLGKLITGLLMGR